MVHNEINQTRKKPDNEMPLVTHATDQAKKKKSKLTTRMMQSFESDATRELFALTAKSVMSP